MKKQAWIAVTIIGIIGSVASILGYLYTGTTPNQSTSGKNSPVISAKGSVTVNIEDYSEGVTNLVDSPFRIAYYRMRGIAPDLLIRGLLSHDWEKILGGQQEIVNNTILKSASIVLQMFEDSPFGDIIYSEDDYPVPNSERLDLRTYSRRISKPNMMIDPPQRINDKWKTYLGGRGLYRIAMPDINALRTVLDTDRWPSDYHLFHQINTNNTSVPVIWRSLTSDDLTSYELNIRHYYKAAFKTISDVNLKYYIETDTKVLRGLRYISREGLPEGFMIVVGSPATHGGWELYLQLRDIELEVAVIENVSKHPITIGQLQVKEVLSNSLRSYERGNIMLDEGKHRKLDIYPARVLLTNEKIVIPTRIHFKYPDRMYGFDDSELSSPRYAQTSSNSGRVEIKHPYNSSEHLFYKKVGVMKQNIPPRIVRRFDYGPAWKLESIEINSKTYPIRAQQFSNFNLFLSNEKGSCPFIYTQDRDGGPWLSEGHMILGATSEDEPLFEKKELSNFSGKIQVRENEDEVSFIKDIFIEIVDGTGNVKRIFPERRSSNSKGYDVVTKGSPQVYIFNDAIAGKNETTLLCIKGFYKPFSNIGVLRDTLINGSVRDYN